MRSLYVIALAAGIAWVSAAVAETAPKPIRVAAGASSCSGWKAICESRGPGCDAKFDACLKSGCWSEAKQYGGARHCGLAKR